MAANDLDFLNDVLSAHGSSSDAANADADAGRASAGGAPEGDGQTSTSTTTAGTLAKDSVSDMSSLQPILQALKISAGPEGDLATMSDESISAMLAKLEEANLVTDGLESRLDQLLGQLDGMLESLETSTADVVEQEIESSVEEVETGRAGEEDNVVNGHIVNRNDP